MHVSADDDDDDDDDPLLKKKYLIGKLRPRLEPRLKREGLVWEDAVPVLDGITIELLQQSVKDGIIMEKLLDASGPLLLPDRRTF